LTFDQCCLKKKNHHIVVLTTENNNNIMAENQSNMCVCQSNPSPALDHNYQIKIIMS